MISTDVLQLFDCLKSSRLIYHMQNETIINIHDVHYYEKVEIDFVFQNEFKTF